MILSPKVTQIALMEFERDPAKAASNLAKHGIDFDEALAVFDDPRTSSVVDPRSYDETRYIARHGRRSNSYGDIHHATQPDMPYHQCEESEPS